MRTSRALVHGSPGGAGSRSAGTSWHRQAADSPTFRLAQPVQYNPRMRCLLTLSIVLALPIAACSGSVTKEATQADGGTTDSGLTSDAAPDAVRVERTPEPLEGAPHVRP